MYTNMDPFLVDKVVGEVKSQGIFDQFRKESMADVDTKPAYQNLRQRVEASVSKFLGDLKWKPETNKNHLREKLRKHITEAGFLDTGVERIVDQVVNPKISTVFQPKIEDIAYTYLGIEKPPNVGDVKSEFVTNGALTIRTDLLPTDLEAVSPDSDKTTLKSDSKECLAENLNDSEDKGDDFESPPFEPLEGRALTPPQDEASNQSHTSCISGLTSQDSVSSDHQPVANYSKEIMSRHESGLSQVSSNSRLSVAAPENQNSGKTETEQKPTADMCEEAQMPSFPDSNEKNVKRTLSFDINNQSFKFEDTHHSTASSETLKVSLSSENVIQTEYSNSMSIDETQKDSFLNINSADIESNNVLSNTSVSATSHNTEEFLSQDANCHLVNNSFKIRHNKKLKILQQNNMKANQKMLDTIECCSSESESETVSHFREDVISVTNTEYEKTLHKNHVITPAVVEINEYPSLRGKDFQKKGIESDDDVHHREASFNSMVDVEKANLSGATENFADKAKDSDKIEQLSSSSSGYKKCSMANSSIKTERIALESLLNADVELVIGGSSTKNEGMIDQISKNIFQPKKGENFKGELLYFHSDPYEAQEFNTKLKSLSHIINNISLKKQKSYLYDCDEHMVEVLCHVSNHMAREKLAASGFDFGGESDQLINSGDIKTVNQITYGKKRKYCLMDEDKAVSALFNNSKRQRNSNNLSSKPRRKIADNIECETGSLVVVCYNDMNEDEQYADCKILVHDTEYNAPVNVKNTLKSDEERTCTEKQLVCRREKSSKMSLKNESEKTHFIALKNNQRYLNEDLYKPRAALGNRSKNRPLSNNRV